MAEDGRVRIEKFDSTDFAWWKMQIEALLGECNLDMVLEEKPDGMDKAAEAIWDSKDKKARGRITLALTRSVAFNIMKETTARGMLTALSNMYEKPSAGNRVFMMRMNEGSPVADHINEVNSILLRLSSVGMKFDDTQAVILLSSLPDSWPGFVTTVTETAGTGNLKFDRIRDSVLGEDIRRRNASGGSTSALLSVSSGRGNYRNSGSCGKSSSKAGKKVVCWVQRSWHGKYVDSWVMDSGASFHAMHSGEAMVNLSGSMGRVFGSYMLSNTYMASTSLSPAVVGRANATKPTSPTENTNDGHVNGDSAGAGSWISSLRRISSAK
ncbi:unnamed protein product [Cuscuta campestris]|uniref:Retrotransposon Copia-like N-terminal domain-containing protein n=1 Tax=Cuscuta campestris TaxID=132261 RepID=A0A484NF18_9ASTE|nr:unnamed protein product [Cuscuta campestris]